MNPAATEQKISDGQIFTLLKDSIILLANNHKTCITMMLNRSMRLLTLLVVFAVVAVGASAPHGEKKANLRTLCEFSDLSREHACTWHAAWMQNLT